MIKKFVKCGILGWCLEILFTSFHSFRRREMKLKGNTSIWMFPIYGSVSLLNPLCRCLRNKNVIVRGGLYTLVIFLGEFITGTLLKSRNMCPWDYQKSKCNINGVIRLDYAPYWFLTGLIMEQVLTYDDRPIHKSASKVSKSNKANK